MVLSKFPAASVTAFGSYSADLSIFLSDLDVSIHFPQPPLPPSLPPALPHTSSITTSAESRASIQPLPAPNQHIYLDQSDREEGAAKTETETKTEGDDVICWTIDTQQGGKNALTSPTHRIESEKENEKEKDVADVYCFDESDFIRQEEVSLHYDVNATSSEEEGSDAAGAVTIDDFDDDDDDSSKDEDEVEAEDEVEEVVEEESDVEVEEDLDIQVIGLPSHTSEERRSLHASEMEFSNAFQFDSDDGEYVSATVSAERAEKQRATKERDVIVGKLKSLMPLLKVSAVTYDLLI